MRIRRRTAEAPVPGLTGRVRVARRVDVELDRVEAGDVVVLDAMDLDRSTAERLAAAHVAAVVNAAPSSSGRFPVLGARTLVESGVMLVDDVGADVMTKVRDGDLLRIDHGELWVEDEQVGAGRVQSAESVEQADSAARSGLHARVSALVADAGERLSREQLPEVDGTRVPLLRTELEDRVVVVVAAAAERDELREVARRLRGRRPVIVGVGAGADRAADAGLRCDLVVVGRDAKPGRAVDRRAEVLALDSADLDVPVPPGVTRAHTTSVGSAEDTAVLLAHSAGCRLVITCGVDESLDGVLDRSTRAGSVPLLLRRRTGADQLAGSALRALPRRGSRRPSLTPVVLLSATALAVGLVAGAGPLQDAVAKVVPGVEAGSSDPVAATSAGDEAAAALQSVLLSGSLDNRPVTVLTLPGAADPAPVLASLRAAGAAVDQPIVLTDGYLDPARARVLRDLVVQLAPEGLRDEIEKEPAATDPADQTDRVLVDALGAPTGSSVGARTAPAETLVEGLARMGALVAPERVPVRSELFVVLVPASADPAVVTRVGTLVAALDERGHVVVAAPSDPAADDAAPSSGLVRALRTGPSEGPASKVATVDDVDGAVGQVAAALALAEVAAGARAGDYGTASDAIAALPEITTGDAGRTGG
jgi:uncharacterized membrane-anchored protein